MVTTILAVLLVVVGCGDGRRPPPAIDSAVPDVDARVGEDAALEADGGRDAAVPDVDTGPPPPPVRLSIATWNLQSFPKTPIAAPNVAAQTIEEQGFDLVGIQEIQDTVAFEALDDALADHAGIYAFDDGAFIRVGLLYRESLLELSETELLFEDDRYVFPRPVLKGRFTIVSGDRAGFDFVFLVVHLKAQIDAESRMRRQLAIGEIEGWLATQLATTAETEYVVVGDYNDELDDPPAENVFGALAPAEYVFLTRPLADAGAYSYLPFDSLIDHVLVTSAMAAALGAGRTDVLELEDTVVDYRQNVSDHRPVVSRFELP